jgi:hypothetical protein
MSDPITEATSRYGGASTDSAVRSHGLRACEENWRVVQVLCLDVVISTPRVLGPRERSPP